MSKIVRAINSMILNQTEISNVNLAHDEYFFLYEGKYKWSIGYEDGDYILSFYPGNETIYALLEYMRKGNFDYPYVSYNSGDLKTQEAEESFGELFLIVKEKVYGLDKILDDIIKD